MVRERIVAAASGSHVIVGGEDKIVRALGERGRVPVEVTCMRTLIVKETLELFGLAPTL